MLQLHYANRLENLIEPLAEKIEAHQVSDPLKPLSIIVPNRALEQFAKYGIAERLGVAANLKFPFLRRYLAEIVERADPSIRVLEVSRLQVVLFECLRSDAHRADRAFQPIRDYIMAANPENAAIADLRLFELAARTAYLFQEYSISRSTMIQAWGAGKAATRSDEELWQRTLWTAVFDHKGAARSQWTRDTEHRWMLLPDALDATDDPVLRPRLPPALHVFGLASPGRVFLEMFARIGALTDLFVYALNPCMEFWEDVDTSAAARRDRWRHRSDRVGTALDEREDPFDLVAPADTRALQLWGRPGREYIRMLNELTECDFQPHFSHPTTSSLLGRLQEDILVRAVEGIGDQPVDDPKPASIRFIGAPGIRREVEIVANEVLRLAANADKSEAPLRFHEIALLIPEAVADAYLPHVQSVFASQFGIPIEIVGRRSSRGRAAEAIDLLLKFPLGRATRDEMLRLMINPVIAGASNELDAERLAAWCEELGVFFGTDAAELKNTYVPPNLFQWDQALTRIALGAFMEGGVGEPARPYASEHGSLLPLGLPHDEWQAGARFLRIARGLLSDAREIRSHRLPLAEWATVKAEFVGTYVQPADGDDQSLRDQCLEVLEAMRFLPTDPVGYEVAHSFVSAAISDLAARQGALSGRGVAAGSMETLRGLPFRAIFVMGLNEATFPERDRRDPVDLRFARRHPGDISPPERDRYLFLESLLAARERITFSWVERDAQTGDRLEPSTTLRELESILRAYLKERLAADLTTSHPVSPYDLDYFPGLRAAAATKDLVSFDSDARRGARMIALRKTLVEKFPNEILPGRDKLLDELDPQTRKRIEPSLELFDLPARTASKTDAFDMPLAAIRRFLECPLQGAARYALLMTDDSDAPEEATDEPIALSRLNHAMLLREAFWAARGDPKLFEDEYRKQIIAAQMRGASPAGPFAEAAIVADCRRFARWCRELEAFGAELREWRVFRIGRGDEFAKADKVLPALRLDIPMIGSDGKKMVRRVNLHGSLGAFSADLDRSLKLVARKKSKPQDFLELFIAAIALRAADQPVPSRFEALILGDPSGTTDRSAASWRRALRLPSPEDARRYLADLIAEMTTRTHDYFLPIEAVDKARNAIIARKDPLDPIDNIREGWSPCASDYGPVRNAHDYEPPSEEEIAAIIQRRFGPIQAIFGEKEES